MTVYCAVDTETGHLDPSVAGPWEIAMIRYEVINPDPNDPATLLTVTPLGRHLIHVHPYLYLTYADEEALKIGGFHERHLKDPEAKVLSTRDAMHLVRIVTSGAVLVGSSPWFDRDHLAVQMRRLSIHSEWHHRMRDVPTLVEGAVHRTVGGLDDALAALGIDARKYARHTAMGDAQAAHDAHIAVLGMGKG